MTQHIGVWLDRSGAFVVSLIHGKARTATITSGIEETRRPPCGTEGHCTIIPERRLRRRREEFLRKFYRSIIQSVQNAGTVFVFGPGTAKTELIREMARIKGLASRVVGVETAGRMAPRQAELKVQEFYALRAAASNL